MPLTIFNHFRFKCQLAYTGNHSMRSRLSTALNSKKECFLLSGCRAFRYTGFVNLRFCNPAHRLILIASASLTKPASCRQQGIAAIPAGAGGIQGKP